MLMGWNEIMKEKENENDQPPPLIKVCELVFYSLFWEFVYVVEN